MELRHLRYFQAVAREEHFGRAASLIRIAQPALTRQIKDLETELGVALFERLPRGVRLSGAGRIFLDDTNSILDQVQRSVSKVKGFASGHYGTLRIGFSETASRHPAIPKKILKYRLSEPNVELSLLPMASQSQIEALRTGALDLAIVYDIHRQDDESDLFEHKKVGDSDIVLAIYKGHRLAQRGDLAIKDLDGEPLLFPIRKVTPQFYDRLMRACLAQGVSPNIIQETATHSILMSLVSVGMGIGFTENSPQAQTDNVLLRPVRDLGLKFAIQLLWRKSDASPAVRRFVEAMS